MLTLTDAGFYCELGGFHIDPWRPVERAIITHAHADHARWGCRQYLAATPGLRVLRTRLGPTADIRTLDYGAELSINGVRVSLHPAGHILGSAQVRLEHAGQVWVAAGDYKAGPNSLGDRTCTPFEPVRCHTFITESTFGLPVYRWPSQESVFAEINAWWRVNAAVGRASVLLAYALGKAQRLLSGLDAGIGPIYCHGSVERLVADYRESGVSLPPTRTVPSGGQRGGKLDAGRALVLAPPSANGSPWMRRFGEQSAGFASGWMAVRGARRRRAVDRGFVLSDHADWPGLLSAISATGASRVLVTHGFTAVLARRLCELGLDATPVETRFQGEPMEGDADGGQADEASEHKASEDPA